MQVQARCSEAPGGTGEPEDPVFQAGVAGLGAMKPDGTRVFLAINKRASAGSFGLAGLTGPATMYTVDESTGYAPPRRETVPDVANVPLAPFAVSVLVL